MYDQSVKAQSFDLDKGHNHVTIPFHMVRNMIIIQLTINNKGPFNFILDTGVGLMIITDPDIIDSLNINHKHPIKLHGLGQGDDLEAQLTSALDIRVHGLTSHNVGAAILMKDFLGLSNCAGMPIHGLLGYEFFSNVVVKINFQDSTLFVFHPAQIKKYAKGEKLPLSIENNKPYLQANVTLPNGTEKKCKLIMDIGAGHPLSLENFLNTNELPHNFIRANLGQGFNGPIDGYISRIPKVVLGRYSIENLLTSFPTKHPESISYDAVLRDGNLGLGLLKRFAMIIDYPDSAIYLKPFKQLKAPFEHDMSGLEYYATGDGYKHVIIDRVEPGSAGDLIGLEKDDEIVSINFKSVASMTIEDIDALFKSGDNRSLLLEVFHDNKYDRVILTLKRRI
ncbi:aspartyl protease family protein [Mucilaginibacter sp. X5P1]|uniref:aspartyl protease family protein n=1 Tax=Mucilaginibacter sp. X5P1 TaxID=2723088 RepID=UPI001612B30D|nr:hypothetical protein [Mucilaginibacter sp. X5P1]